MPGMESNRAASISERVYRALLVAYPKEFRCEYGQQMAQAFRDLCQKELGAVVWPGSLGCGSTLFWTWCLPRSRRGAGGGR